MNRIPDHLALIRLADELEAKYCTKITIRHWYEVAGRHYGQNWSIETTEYFFGPHATIDETVAALDKRYGNRKPGAPPKEEPESDPEIDPIL